MLKFYLKKLKNNLTVFVIKTKKLSSLDITLYVKTGSIYEDNKNNGISHLVEHLLFLKTKQFDLNPIGLDICAYTQKDYTYFEITTHKNLLKDGLTALFQVIESPNFTKKNLNTVRNVIEEEKAEFYENSYSVLEQQIDSFLYKNSSLSFNVGGNSKNLKNINIPDVKRWYGDYYHPKNMILTLTGNVDIKKAIKQIENVSIYDNSNNYLSNKIYENKKIKKIIYHKLTSKPIKIKANKHFEQAYLAFVFPTGGINNSKYIDFILLAEILNRKLRQSLENSGLFYNIQLYYHTYLNVGEFRVITACKRSSVKDVLREVNSFINKVSITDSFFKEMKRYMRYQFLLKEDNVDELSSLTLYLLNENPRLTTLKDEVEKINSIKFSEIVRIKREFFNGENSYCFIMD